MKIKSLLATALMLGSVSMANAQGYVPGFGGKLNSVKADFNLGWFISEFEDGYGDKHSWLFGTGFSVSYNHVFKQGFGFGLDYIMENGNDDNIKTQFIGPSFVYAGSFGGWTLSYSGGLGYGKFEFDSKRMGYDDRGGLGYFAQVEAQKRFSDHFGIGAGMRVLNVATTKPDGYEDKWGTYGTSSFRFTIGPRFYF